MIQLQNVTKRIKENTVLDNVSYTFKSGFVYGLYGFNVVVPVAIWCIVLYILVIITAIIWEKKIVEV
jgi:ABC-type enterochelin transport system ATPase subunit